MGAECESCGNDTFTNMEHDYYGMCWYATCGECGENLVINEAE